MKFLKTIRFDPSDINVFEQAAEPDEWAIPGGFCFAGAKEGDLKGKPKQAFSNGFLSISSFGFSTFTSVADITQDEVDLLAQHLTQKFVDQFGAPEINAAKNAADGEINFVIEMCRDVSINTVFALGRYFDETSEMHEEFRIVEAPSAAVHTKVWEIIE